jgi:ribonuclease E
MSETEARSEAPQRPEPSPPAESPSGDSTDSGGTGSVEPTTATATTASPATTGESTGEPGDDPSSDATRKRRRRGSRGGRKRAKARPEGAEVTTGAGIGAPTTVAAEEADAPGGAGDDTATPEVRADERGGRGGRRDGRGGRDNGRSGGRIAGSDRAPDEMPDPPQEGRPSVEAADKALVRRPAPSGSPAKPKIGDTMPAPPAPPGGEADGAADKDRDAASGGGRRRGRGRGGQRSGAVVGAGSGTGVPADDMSAGQTGSGAEGRTDGTAKRKRRRRGRGKGSGPEATQGDGGRRRSAGPPVEMLSGGPVEIDDETLERRRGRERKGRPVGRYMMCVQVSDGATQIAVLEGRALIEHYVSRPQDDIAQIHGNIYLGRVQNVLPGMEAAFVDIGTPKNAVLYRGDVHYDREDVERTGNERNMRIEQMLRAGQTILCQVTKNPIGAKGARLTQEVSLPGRFVVLIPNSSTYGISKRLPDDERKRLRQVLDRVKPAQHGIIVRTAAEGVTSEEIENDVRRLLRQWEQIDALAKRSKAPTMLYREPDMAVRVIREEFNQHYRGVVIDDKELYEQVRDYVGSISPTLADRVELYDPKVEPLPLFERHHVHEQLHRALDPKVWLPSGGSLIIERTEALTVIDVNTGKNVGKSSLEDTVFKNNLEAAVEIARQLRLRDIGGIIVVDFIDMERRDNRDEVVQVFRDALSRDKTRTQVFEISELGLCEMTRKRIGEGLLESFSTSCPVCEGRGIVVDKELLPD